MLILSHLPDTEATYVRMRVLVNGLPAALPTCRVSAMPYNTVWPGHQRPLDQTEIAPFLSFEANEAVTLRVTYDHPVGEVIVRPLSRAVTAVPEEDTTDPACTFTVTLPSPGAYCVEADGFHEALHVFFDPIKEFEKEIPADVRHILRYGPGVHHIGRVELASDSAVLIHRDAVLYGNFTAFCAQNIHILGYGVLDGREELRGDGDDLLLYDYESPLPRDREGLVSALSQKRVLDGLLRFYRCRDVRVEGLILRDAATFAVIPAGCDHCTFENVKIIGMWRYNSDGIDLFNCRDITVRNSFFRDFDDCIVLKGIAGWDDAPMEDIRVEGCVIWCDWGRGLELGAETNAPEYRNITFSDCDCIHGSTAHMDIQHHNRAEIHHVVFENIRAEYTRYQLPDTYQSDMNAPFPTGQPVRHPLLMALPIHRSGLFSTDGLNGRTHDILFKDIRILTDAPDVGPIASAFIGLDEAHTVSGVTVQNVTRDGTPLTSAEALHLETNEFVKDVVIL